MTNERNIIEQLTKRSHGFIGDDAAILPSVDPDQYVITKDLLIENRHFRTRYFSAQDLAHKALHVNLSDLAAMGAKPLYILCGIAAAKKHETYAQNFLDALLDSCQLAGVKLIGGDTVASEQSFCISITAIGSNKAFKLRNTADSGDWITVIGNLGWADVGLKALEHHTKVHDQYIKSFLRPQAKIKEGQWLARQTAVTSMMDISDGLYIDLQSLCQMSNKGAVINLDWLSDYRCPGQSLSTMLEGGEDYGLLCTVQKAAFDDLKKAFSQHFGQTMKVVGWINDTSEVVLHKNGRHYDGLALTPFTHFGEAP